MLRGGSRAVTEKAQVSRYNVSCILLGVFLLSRGFSTVANPSISAKNGPFGGTHSWRIWRFLCSFDWRYFDGSRSSKFFSQQCLMPMLLFERWRGNIPDFTQVALFSKISTLHTDNFLDIKGFGVSIDHNPIADPTDQDDRVVQVGRLSIFG